MKIPCHYCGTALPVQTLAGTTIRIEGDCPNEWCPNPARIAKKNRETWRSVVAVLGFVLLGAGIAGWYFVLAGMERGMGEDCRDRGGEWAPVRGIFGLPTGTGICVEREEGMRTP